MNDDYSYVGVPATTKEAMENEEHDHPLESSETHTLAGPSGPKATGLPVSAPLVGPFLLSTARNLTSWS